MTRDDALRGTTRNERGIATMPQQLSGKKEAARQDEACSRPLTLYMLVSVTCMAEYSRRKQSDITGVMSESQLSANSSPESNVHRSWHHHPAKRKKHFGVRVRCSFLCNPKKYRPFSNIVPFPKDRRHVEMLSPTLPQGREQGRC